MVIIFKGFEDDQMILSLGKIIKDSPINISKFVTNIADISIEEGNFIITKKGDTNE